MNWKFVPRPYHARDNIGAIVAGMVLYGLVNFVVGVYYISFQTDARLSDPMTYDIAKLIMMSFVLIIGLYILSKRAIPEGLALILSGTSTVVFSASALLGGGDISSLDLMVGAFLLLPAASFALRGDGLLAIGTGVMAVGAMTYSLIGGLSFGWIGIACLISAVASLLYGFSAWYTVVSDKETYPWQEDEKASAANSAVGTGGFVVMGLLSFVVGAFYLNAALDFMVMSSTPYDIAKVIMSSIILYYAALGLTAGKITSGMMSLMFGSSTLTFSVSALALDLGGVEELDVLLGIVMLFAAVSAYKERNVTMASVAFLVFLAFSIYPFLPDSLVYYSVGMPLLVIGAILTFKAVTGLLGPDVRRIADDKKARDERRADEGVAVASDPHPEGDKDR